MALIEYRINIDKNGNATVCQDVMEINTSDQIQFVLGTDLSGQNKPTAIQFDKASPFASPKAGDTVQVQPRQNGVLQPLQIVGGGLVSQPVKVVSSTKDKGVTHFVMGTCNEINQPRKTFNFLCGFLNPAFTLWGGGGADCPSGGSTP